MAVLAVAFAATGFCGVCIRGANAISFCGTFEQGLSLLPKTDEAMFFKSLAVLTVEPMVLALAPSLVAAPNALYFPLLRANAFHARPDALDDKLVVLAIMLP